MIIIPQFLNPPKTGESERSFSDWGVQRGKAPLAGDWGCLPIPKFPQDWGTKGVESF